MKKLVLLLSLTLTALARTVQADLDQTRSQIEAKYGKEINDGFLQEGPLDWPASIKGRDGKIYKRPPTFYAQYRQGRSDIAIHYNEKGIVTEVWYRCPANDQYTEADLGTFLEQNGFEGYKQPTSYAYEFYRGPSQLVPNTWLELQQKDLNKPNAYLSISWADANGDELMFRAKRLFTASGEDWRPGGKVIEIRFMTLEGFAETQKSCERARKYSDIVEQVTGRGRFKGSGSCLPFTRGQQGAKSAPFEKKLNNAEELIDTNNTRHCP